jgi:hypothetical protein
MPRPFTARYAGRCADCRGRIEPGQRIHHPLGAMPGELAHHDADQCRAAGDRYVLNAWRDGPQTTTLADWLNNGVRAGSVSRDQADRVLQLAGAF